MEYPPASGVGEPVDQSSPATLLDPQRYVREADLALRYGSREDVIALIAQAYLAFDLVAAECQSLNDQDMVHSEKNS
jgi:hypothetical protein